MMQLEWIFWDGLLWNDFKKILNCFSWETAAFLVQLHSWKIEKVRRFVFFCATFKSDVICDNQTSIENTLQMLLVSWKFQKIAFDLLKSALVLVVSLMLSLRLRIQQHWTTMARTQLVVSCISWKLQERNPFYTARRGAATHSRLWRFSNSSRQLLNHRKLLPFFTMGKRTEDTTNLVFVWEVHPTFLLKWGMTIQDIVKNRSLAPAASEIRSGDNASSRAHCFGNLPAIAEIILHKKRSKGAT